MNNIDFLQEVDSQGQAGELSSIPSAEVDLYGRRGFEDSTRGQALTPGEFEAELHSRNLGACMVVERPFPSRALNALSIYPEYLEDLGRKLTSSVEGGLQQEITERARFFSQPDTDTNVERKEL